MTDLVLVLAPLAGLFGVTLGAVLALGGLRGGSAAAVVFHHPIANPAPPMIAELDAPVEEVCWFDVGLCACDHRSTCIPDRERLRS